MLSRRRNCHGSPEGTRAPLLLLSLAVAVLGALGSCDAPLTTSPQREIGLRQTALTISESRRQPAAPGTPEFLPGRVLVQLRQEPTRTAAAAAAAVSAPKQARGHAALKGLQLRRLVGPHQELPVGIVAGSGSVETLSMAAPAAALEAARGGAASNAAADSMPADAIMELEITDGSSVEDKVKELRSNADVAIVEPVYLRRLLAKPNDPSFPQRGGAVGQWHLRQVSAPAAWAVTKGSRKVKVCVIDSGVRTTHEDLARNLIGGANRGHLIDYSLPRVGTPAYRDLTDRDGHGTHVAGTIGAVGSNGKGVTGVAWEVSIFVCKAAVDSGPEAGTLSNVGILDCYSLCNREGAKVVSASYGGSGYSQTEMHLIEQLGRNGTIVVTAAGNDKSNNDAFPSYPASYNLDNVIAVAATAASDELASFSNWGPTSVHLAAPGVDILSTSSASDNKFERMSGTSMATPIVSGAAALLLSAKPTATVAQIRKALLSSVDQVPALAGKVTSGGRLNIQRALAAVLGKPLPPSPPPPKYSWNTEKNVRYYYQLTPNGAHFELTAKSASACMSTCQTSSWCYFASYFVGTLKLTFKDSAGRIVREMSGDCLQLDKSAGFQRTDSFPGAISGYKMPLESSRHPSPKPTLRPSPKPPAPKPKRPPPSPPKRSPLPPPRPRLKLSPPPPPKRSSPPPPKRLPPPPPRLSPPPPPKPIKRSPPSPKPRPSPKPVRPSPPPRAQSSPSDPGGPLWDLLTTYAGAFSVPGQLPQTIELSFTVKGSGVQVFLDDKLVPDLTVTAGTTPINEVATVTLSPGRHIVIVKFGSVAGSGVPALSWKLGYTTVSVPLKLAWFSL